MNNFIVVLYSVGFTLNSGLSIYHHNIGNTDASLGWFVAAVLSFTILIGKTRSND